MVKAYQTVAMASRLVNTNALLLVYLEGLIQDLEFKRPPVRNGKGRGHGDPGSEFLVIFGNSLAQLTIARQHVWLSQATIVHGEVFGPAAETALDGAQKVRLDTQSIHQLHTVEACGSGISGEVVQDCPAASFSKTELLPEFWTCEAGFSLAAGAGLPMFGRQLWVCQASPAPLTVCIAVSIVHLNACHQCTSCPWGIGTLEFGYHLQSSPPRFWFWRQK